MVAACGQAASAVVNDPALYVYACGCPACGFENTPSVCVPLTGWRAGYLTPNTPRKTHSRSCNDQAPPFTSRSIRFLFAASTKYTTNTTLTHGEYGLLGIGSDFMPYLSRVDDEEEELSRDRVATHGGVQDPDQSRQG